MIETDLDLSGPPRLGRDRSASPFSEKDFREISREKLFDAWQTYSTNEAEGKRRDMRDKNGSPDLVMVLDLDCNLTCPNRQLEHQMPLDSYREGVAGGSPPQRQAPAPAEEHWLDPDSSWDATREKPLPEFDWD